ncbi:uncharacterized protein CBL_03246 [Carabus blaptoides fortunei]
MTPAKPVVYVAVAALVTVCVQGRAVNISNTWVLPEEGFPVFYRYFRDRISWYEADAVCQFHHGNLVTVDTTSQFDAVRAYLKELDIVSNVWIGLTRPSDKTEFSWSGEHPLSGEGYWGEAAPASGVAVCVAADPAADFRWHALTCGGPEVASFICELPVPPWATGSDGCMLTSLPSLTVIYLPEQTAVELTSDCGLDGTKRIACKGNADHEEMMRQLSCGITREDFDEKAVSKPPSQITTIDSSSSSSSNIASRTTSRTAATKPWIWTSNTIDYDSPTRHRRETEDTFSTAGGLSTTDITSQVKHMDTTETTSIKPDSHSTLKSNFATTILARFGPTDNPMPETTRQRPSDKTFEPLTTTKPGWLAAKQSAFTTTLATVETQTEQATEDMSPGEYPSINQGQLFSIIENGTMFDIIEVNDTTGDVDNDKTTSIKSNPTTLTNVVTTKMTKLAEDAIFTTVRYYRETTVKTENDENKTLAPGNRSDRTDKLANGMRHSKTVNDLPEPTDDKTFMKTIETDVGSLVKLNRTNRKELPLMDFNSTDEIKLQVVQEDYALPKQNASDFKEIDKDFTISSTYSKTDESTIAHDGHEHKIVEITITDVDRKADAPKLYVTTKKYNKSRGLKKSNNNNNDKPNRSSTRVIETQDGKTVNIYPDDKTSNDDNNSKKNFTADININIEISEMPFENITDSNGTADESVLQITIDSKLGDLNKNATRNSISEDITDIIVAQEKSEKLQQTTATAEVDKEMSDDNGTEFDEGESMRESEIKDPVKTTEEPLEPIPEAQPRPNRNRVLTRPQRRSFYPYFFSRVLG